MDMVRIQETKREEDNDNDKAHPWGHPFSNSIISAPLPQGFELPRIEKYDGSSDPQDHLEIFNAQMLFYGATDPIMCRAFPSTLTNHALRWFFTLPPTSINNFAELSTKFLSHFALSITPRKTCLSLTNLKQRPHESLKEYLHRFNQEAIQVDDLSPKLSMYLIEAGLKPGPFADSLAHKPSVNLDGLRGRATLYISDEGQAQHDNKRGRDHSCETPRTRGKFSNDKLHDLPISFSDDDYTGIDDPLPMVITVNMVNCVVYRVSMDQGSSADILYWPAFLKLGLSESMLRPFEGALVDGITGKLVEVKGYVDLETTFGEGKHATTIKVRYLVVDSFCVYNVIIGRPGQHALGAVVSTAHLTMKYPAANGKVGVVRADLKRARQCYSNTLNSSMSNVLHCQHI